ncbi:MAG: hypothetical protein SH868_00710 [Bythopirellula sp.]|nr:hypothetical protein [Bythopirellula sp.]
MALMLTGSGVNISDAYGVVAPSTFNSSIQVQGEAAGTEFDDWAGIPIGYTDNGGVADNPGGFVDINTIQIANDDDNLYIYVDLVTSDIVAMATMYLAFDLDNNLATGHNLFALGAIGSELGYQTDYPFVQDAANFNTGVDGVVEFGGDFIGLGFTFPFYDVNGPPRGNGMEWTIPRSLAIGPTAPGTPVFTGNTFTFIAYTDLGNGDLPNTGGSFEQITYTFASNPNPGDPGDFDGDGDVDGRDFLLWQRGGSPTAFSPADLQDWQTNYGAGGLAAFAAVPEPSSVVFVSACLIGLLTRRRRA